MQDKINPLSIKQWAEEDRPRRKTASQRKGCLK